MLAQPVPTSIPMATQVCLPSLQDTRDSYRYSYYSFKYSYGCPGMLAKPPNYQVFLGVFLLFLQVVLWLPRYACAASKLPGIPIGILIIPTSIPMAAQVCLPTLQVTRYSDRYSYHSYKYSYGCPGMLAQPPSYQVFL